MYARKAHEDVPTKQVRARRRRREQPALTRQRRQRAATEVPSTRSRGIRFLAASPAPSLNAPQAASGWSRRPTAPRVTRRSVRRAELRLPGLAELAVHSRASEGFPVRLRVEGHSPTSTADTSSRVGTPPTRPDDPTEGALYAAAGGGCLFGLGHWVGSVRQAQRTLARTTGPRYGTLRKD